MSLLKDTPLKPSICMSPRNPFTSDKQAHLRQLLTKELPALTPSVDELLSWLVQYITDEDFFEISSIRQDLLDPSYSAIVSKLQSQFKYDDRTIQTIVNILLFDIFPSSQHDRNSSRPSLTLQTDSEFYAEEKVFYPTSTRRASDNELVAAFADTIGGLDQLSPVPPSKKSAAEQKVNGDGNVEQEEDMRSTSHIGDEITPLPFTRDRVSSDDGYEEEEKDTLRTLPTMKQTMRSQYFRDADNLRGLNSLRSDFSRGVPRQDSRWADPEDLDDPIEDECVSEMPRHLNVALFHRSDDESLELLIDKAVLEICYGDKFKELWQRSWFVKAIYSDKSFPKAVNHVFTLVDDAQDDHKGYGHDEDEDMSDSGLLRSNGLQRGEKRKILRANTTNSSNKNRKLGFIGNFVDEHFERQIKEYKRKIEGQADMEDMETVERNRKKSDDRARQYHVYCDDKGKGQAYTIQKEKYSHATKLMTLEIEDDPLYSWAVWKKYSKVKDNNIKSKGYWKVLEKQDEEIQHDKLMTELREFAGVEQEQQAQMNKLQKFTTTLQLKTSKTPSTPGIITAAGSDSSLPGVSSAGSPSLGLRSTKKLKPKPKFFYVPLNHLKLIYELMQFHYRWSIEGELEKKVFEKENPEIVDTPFYRRYCGKQKYQPMSQEEDKIIIEGIQYTLVWWNYVGQKKCNAFCLLVGDDDREYFYLRFKNRYKKKLRWDWYDNDHSRYERYKFGENDCVYKELEASFQANIDENFPQKIFRKDALYADSPRNQYMFDVCVLMKLKETLQKEKGGKFKQNFLLKFSFTDKNRIMNIEQLSIWKERQTFARNVRRLIDNRNTIYFYFQSTDEYIEEWKKRYSLSTLQQQKYFFSFILCICAVMKYIEIEFSHQMVSFPYKKNYGHEQGVFTNLDDSDVQRHKRDYQLWNGFFIPPEHQFQTSQISRDFSKPGSTPRKSDRKSKQKNATQSAKAWYKSLAIVEPLRKFVYVTSDKFKKSDQLTGPKSIFCSHKANPRDILWLSNTTQEVYCQSCGILLQFTECVRKYVLESENREVTDFLWPWYRNYFHRRDIKKYHTYVAKYNLSHLFRIEDVLNKKHEEDKEQENSGWNNTCFCCGGHASPGNEQFDVLDDGGQYLQSASHSKYEAPTPVERDDGDDVYQNNANERTQIRHLRKFAAHVLLGGWDILRSLNVIRNQLQCLLGYEESDEEKHVNLEEKKWDEWETWKMRISKCNEGLKNDLNKSAARKLMELHHEDQLIMKHEEQAVFAKLMDVILKTSGIYDEQQDRQRDMDEDEEESDGDELFSPTAVSNPEDATDTGYYTEFKKSWRRVPAWWFHQHDKLLLELALKFNWNTQQYHEELTHPAKKQYYQVLLSNRDPAVPGTKFEETVSIDASYQSAPESDDDDNVKDAEEPDHVDDDDDEFSDQEDDYIGYQEFQVWCENWRNIQHRLRYLTFVICKYLYSCSPSMVSIRIPNEHHRIEQYKCKSIAFLNGYMEHVHVMNCKDEELDLNNIQEANNKLRHIAQDYFRKPFASNLQNLSSNSKKRDLQKRRMKDTVKEVMPIRDGLHLTAKQSKSHQWWQVLSDDRAKRVIRRRSSKKILPLMHRHRIRDPFMRRDLDFEMEQVCQSFDLLKYGVDLATFLIVLLKRKQLDALWSALGIVLEHMPYERARYILECYQEDLRHGQPEQLKTVCDRIISGSNFSVHICLFLAEYMENNSKVDLARYHQWMKYSKSYEQSAGLTINTIESNHLLAVLLDIPLTYSGGAKVSLLQVALEQNRAEFLNNERINAVMAHVWQSPSGLAPNTEIMQKNDSYADVLCMLFDKPYHFYLTPMGFNASIKSLHLAYVLCIFYFVSQRIYLDTPIETGEWFLWSLNIGYILYECIEAYDKGIRVYLSLAGWVNVWDLSICAVWITLFSIRLISWYQEYHVFDHSDEAEDEHMASDSFAALSQAYFMLWAMQTASLSARSLVLFQTSEYFGVLLRMMLRLMAEMVRFMFVLGLILVGFVFGLYYIQGGFDVLHERSLSHWYDGFKYLFQLTVGAGDFSEIDDAIFGGAIFDEQEKAIGEIYVIGYLIVAAILMMNLLIALLTTTYENIHLSAKTASSFAFAEMTYDLSHRSRFMPAPICIYIFCLAIVIHIVNFIPAIILPQFNIYNCINHYQYEGLDQWRLTVNGCLNCKKYYKCCRRFCARLRYACCCLQRTSTERFSRISKMKSRNLFDSASEFERFDEKLEQQRKQRFFLCCKCSEPQNEANLRNVDLRVRENGNNAERNNRATQDRRRLLRRQTSSLQKSEKTYRLVRRGRTCKYYSSTFCCCGIKKCDNWLKPYRFEIYHNGCYSCIPTALGAKERVKNRSLVNGITLNEYAELYEKYHQFHLDPQDTVLLKHLTVDSLFCKVCYRPFDPKSLDGVLLTPFWALSELISIYTFPLILWLPLCIVYGLLTLIEMVRNCLEDDREIEDVDDYDRQYFAREALQFKKPKKLKQRVHSDSSSSSSSDSDSD